MYKYYHICIDTVKRLMKEFNMDEKDINALREKLKSYMQNHPQSMNWYARRIDISNATLKDFLNSVRPSSPNTLARIRGFLKDKE